MQSRLTNQNQNYKIFAKLRPIDYSQKMVDATNECVSIRVLMLTPSLGSLEQERRKQTRQLLFCLPNAGTCFQNR